MKNSILLTIVLMFVITTSKAQTALQISGPDCNGVPHDLYADLDAGKASVVFFFMPNCASCPPPAQAIQAMANNIMATYPGKVTGYAMPFNNTTPCSGVSLWVNLSGVPFYAPYDSGATPVAYYGGFGMPTVVLLGGSDHRVVFSTQNFIESDTTIMRDSILALFNAPTTVADLKSDALGFSVFPNPANDNVTINFTLNEISNVKADITDINGKQVANILNEKLNGAFSKQYNTSALPNGNYFVRLTIDNKESIQKLTIKH